LLGKRGEVLKSGRVANLGFEMEDFLYGFKRVRAVLEAGRSSYTIVDVLAGLGIKTAVAHPKDVRAIAKAKVKTDERDSYKLAHLLRMGYIPEVYKRSRENRSSQRVLCQRTFCMGKQTAVKNRLLAFLVQQGEEIRLEVAWVENLFTEKGMKVLAGLAFPNREAKMVGGASEDLSSSGGTHQRDERFSRRVVWEDALCPADPECFRVWQIFRGIGGGGDRRYQTI
jgi:hypothetical protein